MNTKLMTVTPAMARKWLEEAEKQIAAGDYYQRPMSERHARRLANQMILGFWVITHQGIAFNEKGHLVDGRHRLWAVLISGVTIKILVSTGLPELAECGVNTFDGIDAGFRPRSTAHVLQSHGFHSAIYLAAIANSLVSLCDMKEGSGPAVSAGQAIEIHNLVKKEFAAITEILPANKTRGAVAATIIAYARINRDGAIDFAEKYATGANVPSLHPVLALKAWEKRESGRGSGSRQKVALIRVVAQALQHAENGGKVKLLRESVSAQEWLQSLDKAFTRKVLAIAYPKFIALPTQELKLAA